VLNKNKIFIFILNIICIVGCSSVQTVSPTYLLIDSSKSITISLFDGRVINFRAGDYSVTDMPDSSFIMGNGIIVHKQTSKNEVFIGTIYLREIKELKYREPAPTWQTTPLIIVGSLIIAIAIFVSTFKVTNI
jgi:hypothetical protein